MMYVIRHATDGWYVTVRYGGHAAEIGPESTRAGAMLATSRWAYLCMLAAS